MKVEFDSANIKNFPGENKDFPWKGLFDCELDRANLIARHFYSILKVIK